MCAFLQCGKRGVVGMWKFPKLGEQTSALMDSDGVVMFSLANCQFCLRARLLLDKAGVKYSERQLDNDMDARRWVMESSGGRRVLPQLFVDGRHVAGYYELVRLANQGILANRLTAKSPTQ